jgi:hypothetical protein
MVRLNLPDRKLESVLEEESAELDTVIIQTRKLEFIQYNKQLTDGSEIKIIQKEKYLLAREDLIRKDVVNINCLNGKKINKTLIFSFQRLDLLKYLGTQLLLLL